MLWAIFNLSRNPGAQRKLLQEIREVVPADQDPCGEHLKSMPYLKACLKESMRYSKSWVKNRPRGPLTTWLSCTGKWLGGEDGAIIKGALGKFVTNSWVPCIRRTVEMDMLS